MRLGKSTLLAGLGFAAGLFLEKSLSARAALAKGRRLGHFAANPFAIPWRGWREILLRLGPEAINDRIFAVAAGVAFYTLLALPPAISLLVSLYGLVMAPQEIYRQLSLVTAQLPEAARQIIEDQAIRLTNQPVTSLSFAFLVSFGLAAWSANAAIKALFDGLNVIYGEREKRSFLVFNLVSLATTIGAILLMSSALFVIAAIPALFDQGPLGASLDRLLGWLRWPAFLAGGTLAIGALYRLGPSRPPARWAWIAPGAILAALLWMLVSVLFSWYVSTLGNYAPTYGSLTTIVIFMTWLWLSAVAILVGAELAAQLERQTQPDEAFAAKRM